jgi:hypothetical protein
LHSQRFSENFHSEHNRLFMFFYNTAGGAPEG